MQRSPAARLRQTGRPSGGARFAKGPSRVGACLEVDDDDAAVYVVGVDGGNGVATWSAHGQRQFKPRLFAFDALFLFPLTDLLNNKRRKHIGPPGEATPEAALRKTRVRFEYLGQASNRARIRKTGLGIPQKDCVAKWNASQSGSRPGRWMTRAPSWLLAVSTRWIK